MARRISGYNNERLNEDHAYTDDHWNHRSHPFDLAMTHPEYVDKTWAATYEAACRLGPGCIPTGMVSSASVYDYDGSLCWPGGPRQHDPHYAHRMLFDVMDYGEHYSHGLARQPSPPEAMIGYPRYRQNSWSSSSDTCYENSPPQSFDHYSAGYCHSPASSFAPDANVHGISPCDLLHDHQSEYDHFTHLDTIELDTRFEHGVWAPKQLFSPPEPTWASPAQHEILFEQSESTPPASESDSDYAPARKAKTRVKNRIHVTAKVSKKKHPKASPIKRSTVRQSPAKDTQRASCSSSTSAGEQLCKLRIFGCPLWPYGCHSTFSSKNEWKRHFVSQHLCLGFYRCSLCVDHDDNPNDFNRKDLFQQHLKRMHNIENDKAGASTKKASGSPAPTKAPASPTRPATDTSVDVAQLCEDCYVKVHDPPNTTTCVFCPMRFDGSDSCRDWLEHVGKHLASSVKDGKKELDINTLPWIKDDTLRNWLLDVGAIVPEAQDTWRLADNAATSEIRARAYERKLQASSKTGDANGEKAC